MSRERLQVRIVGSVQGVGFRPFVFRLARDADLRGWVRNDGDGMTIEVEGDHAALLDFLERVRREKPTSAIIYALDHRFLQPAGFDAFEIETSQAVDRPRVWVLPDLATCAHDNGLLLGCTPFDLEAVDLLASHVDFLGPFWYL